jgi:hypothetical protein
MEQSKEARFLHGLKAVVSSGKRDECDMVAIIRHKETPDAEVTKQLNDIINEIPASDYTVMHVHRYENETALLLKKTK